MRDVFRISHALEPVSEERIRDVPLGLGQPFRLNRGAWSEGVEAVVLAAWHYGRHGDALQILQKAIRRNRYDLRFLDLRAALTVRMGMEQQLEAIAERLADTLPPTVGSAERPTSMPLMEGDDCRSSKRQRKTLQADGKTKLPRKSGCRGRLREATLHRQRVEERVERWRTEKWRTHWRAPDAPWAGKLLDA